MKKLYFSSKLETNVKNSKKTWDTINEVQGKSRKSECVDKININGAVETDPLKIAREFNSFFTRVGKQISDSIPPVSKAPEDYVYYNHQFPDLSLGNTTPEHVKKVISKFQPKTSCDVQGQSTKMIKFISHEISVPLAHIFNLSLRHGVFPEKLKNCRVIPVYKSGDQLDVDNYRPISLLSSVSKILEKIVADKLIYHLLSNDLLYNHQYGFLPKKSTEQNLIQIVNFITEALNEGMYCMGVFLDLRKAFDVCSHEILLKKLEKMGIKGTAHKWFKSYLTNRSQCVDISGHFSEQINLDISVIQGSTLGPILFLCYINDFWRATSLFSVLFADDTTCLAKSHNLRDLTNFVNVELRKIANWFRSNKMALNTGKTKFMIFRTRGKPIDVNDCQVVYNSSEIGHDTNPLLVTPIERVHNNGNERSFKLLGVYFDEYLSFDSHVKHLCNKLSKTLYSLNKIKNFVNLDALKKLYYALVHSSICYCINVYGSATKTTLAPLFLAQKKAVRTITRAKYRDHTGPLFKNLEILPLNELITYHRLKFMHNYYFQKLPPSFANLWQTNAARNPARELRNANDYYIPQHRVEIVKRMPLYVFPSIWNAENIEKLNPNQFAYLKSLKKRLLSNL
jgi:hypothetical protein